MTLAGIVNSVCCWFVKTTNNINDPELRQWCTFSDLATSDSCNNSGVLKSLKREDIAAAFSRKTLNDEHDKRYNEGKPGKVQPYAYLQYEINQIYGAQKSVVARHKTRLQSYVDDCAQKNFFLYNSLQKGLGTFNFQSDLLDKTKPIEVLRTNNGDQ